MSFLLHSNNYPSFDVMVGLAVLRGEGHPVYPEEVNAFIEGCWPEFEGTSQWKGKVMEILSNEELFHVLNEDEEQAVTENTYLLNFDNSKWIQKMESESKQCMEREELQQQTNTVSTCSTFNQHGNN